MLVDHSQSSLVACTQQQSPAACRRFCMQPGGCFGSGQPSVALPAAAAATKTTAEIAAAAASRRQQQQQPRLEVSSTLLLASRSIRRPPAYQSPPASPPAWQPAEPCGTFRPPAFAPACAQALACTLDPPTFHPPTPSPLPIAFPALYVKYVLTWSVCTHTQTNTHTHAYTHTHTHTPVLCRLHRTCTHVLSLYVISSRRMSVIVRHLRHRTSTATTSGASKAGLCCIVVRCW